MNRGRKDSLIILGLAAALAMSLSACGRKGPLEAPPGAMTAPSQSGEETPGQKPQKPDRPFILDGLI